METRENKGKQRVNVLQADAQAETPVLPAPGAPVALSPRREAFAQALAASGSASDAFRATYDCSRMKRRSINELAYRTAHEPAVAERVRQLLAVAAEHATIDARARMFRLQLICEADPGAVARVITLPCGSCWSDLTALAAAIDRGDTPSVDEPREDCETCRGHGQQRVVVTDTDNLDGSARALIKSIRQKTTGEIEVVMHDQLQAADMLNRMQSVYVDRSESKSLTISATVAAPADLSADALLAAWKESQR